MLRHAAAMPHCSGRTFCSLQVHHDSQVAFMAAMVSSASALPHTIRMLAAIGNVLRHPGSQETVQVGMLKQLGQH